jgi:DNA adenine methylase
VKNIHHLVQYQGSKRNLAKSILRYFPKGVGRLIEPFAGSAAISIAAAAHGKAESFFLNDLNEPLSELLRLIVQFPEETASFYEEIWNGQEKDSVGHYYQIRDSFNTTKDPRLLLYLLARCVKGSVRYNSDGKFNQSPDKRRKGARPERMRSNLLGVSALLKDRTIFSSVDYREVLSVAEPGDFVYMDPPYQGVCSARNRLYFSGIEHDGFVRALEELNSRNIPYIVSYDGHRGGKTFGETLPDSLNLTRIELDAGRSSQSTLLGIDEKTIESLYLSQHLRNMVC